jgi:hypothetical protein
VALVDGGPFSGVTSSALTVSNVSAAEVGSYDVRVTGGCNGTIGVTSNPATLTVCIVQGDFNGDNQLDATDIQGFVNGLLAG